MQIKQSDIVNATIVFFFFVLEAMIHYSIGKSSEQKGTGRIKIILPSLRDFVKIVVVVLVFTALSSAVSAIIQTHVLKEEEE